MRQILIYPGEDNCWIAECPSLPGCISEGTTREDALRNIKEAIEGYILALQEDGLHVPAERFGINSCLSRIYFQVFFLRRLI
jgi:predicted RNase H-like HicB family nuclease